MRELIVDGEVVDAGPHHTPVAAQLVMERSRVGRNCRVGDQPSLQFTSSKTDIGHAPDYPVHREPVQFVLHRASIDRPRHCACDQTKLVEAADAGLIEARAPRQSPTGQHSATILKSVVTTLFGLSLPMP